MRENGKAPRGLFLRGGVWYVDVSIRGRRIRRSTNTASLTLAKAIRSKLLIDLAKETHLNIKVPSNVTLGELIKIYLKRPGGNTCDPNSAKRVLSYFDEKVPAESITTTDILTYRRWRSKQPRYWGGGRLSNRTLNIEIAFLKAMFNYGIRAGIVSHNPVKGIPMLPEAKRLRIPTKAEIKRLLDAARQGPGYLHPLIVLAVYTGARRSELLDLAWNDVDLAGKTIWVREGKGAKSRYVSLHPRAVEALKALRAMSNGSERVFPVSDIKRAFLTARRRARLDKSITFHSLRHYCATQLAEAGADAHAIRLALGHTSLAMASRYVHISSDHLKRVMKRLPNIE